MRIDGQSRSNAHHIHATAHDPFGHGTSTYAPGNHHGSYVTTVDGWTHVVEGLVAYNSALRLALANLVQDRIVPGEVQVVSTGGSGSMAEARASLGDSALLIGQGYRQNNAGDYVEAEQYFRPDLLNDHSADMSPQAAAVMAGRRHELAINRALQLSNLGRYAEAKKAFAEANAMELRDPIQARLSRNFEAIDALNRGQLAEASAILARPVPALAVPAATKDGGVASTGRCPTASTPGWRPA